MFSIFVVYHKTIYDEFYKTISEDNKKHIVFYGVKDKIENVPSIYEYELPIYNQKLQAQRYNESSAFYHIYENKLHQNLSYIGFAQYDMIINNEIIQTIKTQISETSTIFAAFFAIEESKKALHGSLNLIVEPISFFGSVIDNYNNFFSTNYKKDDILNNPLIMCNTFVIHVTMYEKYMGWLQSYFINEINVEELNKIHSINSGFLDTRENTLNRGHLIEVCTAVFLAIQIMEGVKLQYIEIYHEHEARV
jgi:hypothetical protein